MLQSKGKQFSKNAEAFGLHLLPNENVLASVQIGLGSYLLTEFRLVSLTLMGGIKFSYPLNEIQSFRFDPSTTGATFWIALKGKPEEKLGTVLEAIAKEFEELFGRSVQDSIENPELRVESKDAAAERYSSIPTNRGRRKFPSHLVKAIQRNSKTGEDPVMVITGEFDSTEGSLIVFEDRCVMSKSGLIAGMMTGSFGGAREATFYFKDITGIEYNSGMVTGVLEILTASYDGSANKDFWSGFLNPDRNRSANDPRASSNTLPLMKSDYINAKPLVDKLRSMIQQAKEMKVVVNIDNPVTAPSTADELAKLASLMDRGLLSKDEFEKAKARLLSE